MGLFSGFKAKFTRNSQSKETKKALQTGVVALNIKFRSEFDLVNSPTQTSNVIKPTTNRIPLARSETFESNRRNLLEKLKSKSLTNLSTSESKEPKIPSAEPKKTTLKITQSFQQPRVSTEEPNSIYVEPNSPVEKSNSLREISRTSQDEDYNYVYLEPSETFEKTLYSEDPSPLIVMTQSEPEIQKPARKKKIEQSEPVHVPEVIHNNTDEDFDFKVNVVQHDKNYTSEDELSYVEDEQLSSFVGYSSQATNIFFGQDSGVPAPARPRRNKVQIRSDSDEEMDC